MSKSILVIDTPECCDYCPIGRIFGMAGQVECRARSGISVNNDGRTIPDWCPLLEFPKRARAGNNTECAKIFVDGYNACIDEILKGANRDEQ